MMRSIGTLAGEVIEQLELERAKAKAEAAGKTASAPKIEGGEQPPLHSPTAGREGVGQPMGKGKDRDANAPAKLGGERQTTEFLDRMIRKPLNLRVIINPALDTMPKYLGAAKPRARNPRAAASRYLRIVSSR